MVGNDTTMTIQDLHNEGTKPKQEEELVELIPTSTFARPTYDEEADQSMHDSFKHVSIPPSTPAPDENAVDILIDDGEHPIQEEVLPLPQQASSLPFLSPFRASEEILPCAVKGSAFRITGFGEIEEEEKAKSTITPSSGNFRDSNIAKDFSTVQPLPSLTEEDMLDALPHHSALFLPDSSEWFVLVPEQDLRKDGTMEQSTPSLTNPNFGLNIPLWKFDGDLTVPKEDQVKPIYTFHSSEKGTNDELSCLESFDRWRSTKGDSLLKTKKGSLPSVLPLTLLENFRQERLSHPRPGWTGEVQFKEATSMLIKVIGNAANGEVRALSITGKAMTNKLGIDEISQKMLRILGFSSEGKPDENGKYSLIKPPDMTQIFWRLKFRRAWLEVLLWYFRKLKITNSGLFWKEISPFIPLRPEVGSTMFFLQRSFLFDDDTQIDIKGKTNLSDDVIKAFRVLGANWEATLEIVEQCYVANTAGKSRSEQIPYFSALKLIAQYLLVHSEVDGSDAIQIRFALAKSEGLYSESDLKAAFAKIGIEVESMEQAQAIHNDFVISVYQGAVNNVAANKEKVQVIKDALKVISASRDRPSDIEEIFRKPVELSVEKAYELLEVNDATDDDFITSVYSVAVHDGAKRAPECTEALRVIAEKRNSVALRKVYRNAIGEAEEWEPADLAIPIGLNNIGNTCYLNSVLQYFFAIGKLRDQVILASQGDLQKVANSVEQPSIRVGGRQVSKREIIRSYRFVQQLGQLFSNMITAPTSAVTPERELAYLALVSSRVEETNDVPDLATAVITSSPSLAAATQLTRPTSVPDTQQVTTEVQSDAAHEIIKPRLSDELMEQEDDSMNRWSTSTDGILTPPLSERIAPPLPARPKSEALDAHEAGQRRNSLMQLGAQQDVSECLDNVMFQIEVALIALETDGQNSGVAGTKELDDGWIEDGDSLRRLFLGRTLQHLELASLEKRDSDQNIRGPSIHTKREVFTILPIDVVEEERDIYDGLDGFFDEEILTGSAGESIRRTVTLTDSPAIMQIQLQRVQFDRIKGVYKSQAHLEVGQTLYMDRYLDFDPLDPADEARLEKRKKGRESRRRIAELRTRLRDLEPEKKSVSETLKQTSNFLSSLTSLKSIHTSQTEDEAVEKVKGIDNLIDVDFSQYLSEEASRVEQEVKDAQREIANLKSGVEELWREEKRVEYVLTSVFMHRGEASHGHYFLNQRKVTQEDKELSTLWYKYNDQSVTEVTWSEVHRDQSGATPYLLCWVRRDKLDHFDTLCRKYEETLIPVAEQVLPLESTKLTTAQSAENNSTSSPTTNISSTVNDTVMDDAPLL